MKIKDKIFLQELREQFLQKLVDEWNQKWQSDFNEFENFEAIKNKNAFLEALLADIEVCLYQKLNGQSSKYLFSKDFLRRFIYEYGSKEARIQSHSRTAISLYLDYESWEDFVVKNQIEESQNININYLNIEESLLPILLKNQRLMLDIQSFTDFKVLKPTRSYRKYLYGCLGIILLGAALFFGLQWWENRAFTEADLTKIKFEIIKTVGKYPQAVRIKYDVSSLPNVHSVEVETGVGTILSHIKNEASILGSTNKIDTLSHTYFYPGIYHLTLIVDKKRVKDLYHVVYSKPNLWTVWGAGVAYGKNWITDISSMDNYTKDGVFHFDPAKLPQEIKGEDDLRSVIHTLTQDFKIGMDSLQIEARLKNPENEGGESCYSMQVSLWDKNFNGVNAKFTTEGCSDYAQLSVGNTIFRNEKLPHSKSADLDGFGVNHAQWNDFKLKLKGNKVAVFVNNKLVFKGTYDCGKPIVNIVDLRFSFKGTGSIDWVKVSNSFTENVVYQTDFEE